MQQQENEYSSWDFSWSPDMMLEIKLADPESFLKIKETLTRIGIPSKKDPVLYQTCHILHKKGKYYIMNFLELFALDGKDTTMDYEDIARRNTIASLLEQWKLCVVVGNDQYKSQRVPISSLKIIPYAEKNNWKLMPKYTLGKYAKSMRVAQTS
mgnify:FL=1